MSLTRVVVITSDNYLWAIRPFAYFFNMFWSDGWPVTVAGFTPPTFRMPKNFDFFQIDTDNYPANQWSNGLIKVLDGIRDEHIILMLEDYWLTRPVDLPGVEALLNRMKTPMMNDVVRFDLTSDRAHARGDDRDAQEWGTISHFDVVETNEHDNYQFSLQAAIWNARLMRHIVDVNRTPWQLELYPKTFPAYYKVLGTKQCPVKYANAIYKGKLDVNQLRMIPEDDFENIKQWIPDSIGKTERGLGFV